MRYSQKACSTTPVQTATWKPSPTRPPSASAATATLTSSRILGSGIRPTLEDLPAELRRGAPEVDPDFHDGARNCFGPPTTRHLKRSAVTRETYGRLWLRANAGHARRDCRSH